MESVTLSSKFQRVLPRLRPRALREKKDRP
jgi:hypothetical protein